MDFLLQKGLSPHDLDSFGYSPFTFSLVIGNLEMATKLSSLPEETLMADPNWNNKPTAFSHDALVDNISTYLKLKFASVDDPAIRFSVPNINGGVCNGWSWHIALEASDDIAKMHDFFEMTSIFSKWDGTLESLKTIPEAYQSTYASLDEMFFDLTNAIYHFYGQRDADIGVSFHDRAKQVSLVSNKRNVEGICDFGLPDFTREEYEQVLSAFQEIANDMIIDVRSHTHDVTYYQKSLNEIYYFDPNIALKLPPHATYASALKANTPYMSGINALTYWHAHPDQMDPKVREKANKITDSLIEKLIMQNPERNTPYKIESIIKHACVSGMPRLLERLVNHPQIKEMKTQELFNKMIQWAALKKNYEILRIVYHQGYDLNQADIDQLTFFLKTAMNYEDRQMFNATKQIIQNRVKKKPELISPELKPLLSFTLPIKKGKPLLPYKQEKTGHQRNVQPSQASVKPTDSQKKKRT